MGYVIFDFIMSKVGEVVSYIPHKLVQSAGLDGFRRIREVAPQANAKKAVVGALGITVLSALAPAMVRAEFLNQELENSGHRKNIRLETAATVIDMGLDGAALALGAGLLIPLIRYGANVVENIGFDIIEAGIRRRYNMPKEKNS